MYFEQLSSRVCMNVFLFPIDHALTPFTAHHVKCWVYTYGAGLLVIREYMKRTYIYSLYRVVQSLSCECRVLHNDLSVVFHVMYLSVYSFHPLPRSYSLSELQLAFLYLHSEALFRLYQSEDVILRLFHRDASRAIMSMGVTEYSKLRCWLKNLCV